MAIAPPTEVQWTQVLFLHLEDSQLMISNLTSKPDLQGHKVVTGFGFTFEPFLAGLSTFIDFHCFASIAPWAASLLGRAI